MDYCSGAFFGYYALLLLSKYNFKIKFLKRSIVQNSV